MNKDTPLFKRILTQLIKYLIAGSTAFVVEYALFSMLFGLVRLHLYLANSLSFIAGFITSFTLNRNWAFRKDVFRHPSHHQLSIYAVLELFDLLIVNVVIGVLKQLSVSPFIGKICAMVFVAALNFTVFRTIIFRKKAE